jgi:hypothetical protein
MTRTTAIVLISLAALVQVRAQANAGLINFENGDFSTAVPRNGTGGGWTSSNMNKDGGHRTSGGNPDGHFILNDEGSSSSDPTIAQTITGLSVGSEYTLFWDFALHVNWANSGNGASFGVFLDSQINANALFIGENLSDEYLTESIKFTATAASHTFIFAAELDNRTNGGAGNSDVSYRLDNVSSVPEPSGFLLGGVVSLCALCGWWVRRARKQSA